MYSKIFEVVLEKNSFKLKINQTKTSKPPPHIQTKIERKKTFVKPVQQNPYVIGLTFKRSSSYRIVMKIWMRPIGKKASLVISFLDSNYFFIMESQLRIR